MENNLENDVTPAAIQISRTCFGCQH